MIVLIFIDRIDILLNFFVRTFLIFQVVNQSPIDPVGPISSPINTKVYVRVAPCLS
jgi:hypothetical protein